MENTLGIAKLAAALARAQGAMKGALKDAQNPFFKSSYADLASVWEACRKALSDNELSVTQIIDTNESGMFLRTMLMHSSGECVGGVMPIQFSEKTTAQQIGALITYFRRYALSAIVGVAPEDDDGNEASKVPLQNSTAKWATSKPGETDKLKADITEFVRKLEMSESVRELENLIEDSEAMLGKIDAILPPEWKKRTLDKIAQCREAFKLAE